MEQISSETSDGPQRQERSNTPYDRPTESPTEINLPFPDFVIVAGRRRRTIINHQGEYKFRIAGVLVQAARKNNYSPWQRISTKSFYKYNS